MCVLSKILKISLKQIQSYNDEPISSPEWRICLKPDFFSKTINIIFIMHN